MTDVPIPCTDAELLAAVAQYEEARAAQEAAYELVDAARVRLAAALNSRGVRATL